MTLWHHLFRFHNTLFIWNVIFQHFLPLALPHSYYNPKEKSYFAILWTCHSLSNLFLLLSLAKCFSSPSLPAASAVGADRLGLQQGQWLASNGAWEALCGHNPHQHRAPCTRWNWEALPRRRSLNAHDCCFWGAAQCHRGPSEARVCVAADSTLLTVTSQLYPSSCMYCLSAFMHFKLQTRKRLIKNPE